MRKGLYRIVGNSGSGKTTALYDFLLKQAEENEGERYFLIVPEQYTLQAQRDVVEKSKRHGTFNIDIVSFMRLSYRIFEELGTDVANVLEDHGKSMLLRKVLGQLNGAFHIYNNMMDKEGFIDQIKSCLSEFFQYQIAEEELQDMIGQSENQLLLKYKLEDLYQIYLAFTKALGERYYVSEQLLTLLTEIASTSELLKGAHFFFDGFTGFTPIQYTLIRKLMEVGGMFYVTFTMDENTYKKAFCHPNHMFYMSKYTYDTLGKMYAQLGESGEEIQDITLFKAPFPRFEKCLDIGALEQNLFRYAIVPYEQEVEHVAVLEASNVRAEAAMVASQIRQYVRSGRYRYREIAVVSADEEGYAPIVKQEFDKYHIAYFLDHNTEVMNHPFVEALRAVLGIVCYGNKGYTYDKMMRYLHTGLAGVSDEEVELLDNYIIATNSIGANYWKNGFVKMPKSMWIRTRDAKQREEQEAKRQAYLVQINEIRSRVMKDIIPFEEGLVKNAKIRDKAVCIYEYLKNCEYQKKLKQCELELLENGELAQAKVYEKMYDSMLELLDKLVDILGEETDISNLELASILDAGLKDMVVGVAPSTMDQVLVGDFMRTRLDDIKVLFVMGMNSCYVPAKVSSPNVLTNQDRASIKNMGVTLAPDLMQAAFQEQFYLYLMLTKPKEQLYVSYSRLNAKGESMTPSYIIDKIVTILPKVPKKVVQKENYFDTKESLYAYLSQGIKTYLQGEAEEQKEDILALYRMCAENETYRDVYERLNKALDFHNCEKDIGSVLARQIYGDQLLASVSRLEQFAGCAYAHFLKYGLGLKEREEYGFAQVDFGNVMHSVLELFGKKVKYDVNITYQNITDQQIESLSAICVKQALQDGGYDFSMDSARQQYVENTVSRMAYRTLRVLCRHLKLGSFEPQAFELSFGPGKELDALHFTLGQNAKMSLRGTIDRMDLKDMVEEGLPKAYIKVIDYKTGTKKFDITMAYYGLQMQLLTYMLVALRAGNSLELNHKLEGVNEAVTKYEPGALLYYHVDDPVFDSKNNVYDLQARYENQEISQEQYEQEYEELLDRVNQEVKDKFRMNGLINGSSEVLDALELPKNKSEYAFESVSVKYSKNETITKTSKCQSPKEIQDILDYTEKQMQRIGEDIINGCNQMNPYQYKAASPCTYCVYSDICQFDERNGNQYRVLKEKTQQDFANGEDEE